MRNKDEKKQEMRKRREAQRKEAQIRGDALHSDEAVGDLSPESSLDENEIRVFESSSPSEEGEDEVRDDPNNGSVVQGAATTSKAKKKVTADEPSETYLNPNEIHASLVQLFAREKDILSLVYNCKDDQPPLADMFFIRTILVPPNKWRKENKTGPETITEDGTHEIYKRVLTLCSDLFQIRRELRGEAQSAIGRQRNYDDLQYAWINLQGAVNGLIDSTKAETRGARRTNLPDGVKQRLEKKEGLFRMNVMGKRVNFAARSVISPDPNIETNEVGIPPVFAMKLTYPEPVTAHSFDELKQAVLNGPEEWPGASAVEYENGQVIALRNKNIEERQAIANMLLAPSSSSMTGVRNKKVHRHLNNGDIVLMNRQPTLHKPSIMAHRAKVLPGEKTIRMHYANCNTYNADFDGDEMNLHFPQNEIARAEAFEVADTDQQYLSATAGKPLKGVIQDHVSMGVWLTCLDTFLTREEYQELLYSSLRPESGDIDIERIRMIEPMMLKPCQRWTGKQVISTILLNLQPNGCGALHMQSQSQTPSSMWGPGSEEATVRISDSLLTTGIMDKKQIGPSADGLVHIAYEAWGARTAGKLIGVLARLLTRLLNMRAFSCGVEDLVLTEEGEAARNSALSEADTVGTQVAAKYVSLENEAPNARDPELLSRLESVIRDDEKLARLDALVGNRNRELTSNVSKNCVPSGLYKDFPRNQMQLMTSSGAKGSGVNANQISCNLGQQTLEGRRVPIMVSGKTLPSFTPFDTSIRAGGFITDRFLTGVRPQEFYFHAMAGREGLIDTAVKTSRSGYLQRCLVKGMEGLKAEYDASIRDSDGTVIQSLYGEDGLDVTKQKAIDKFTFVAQNFVSLFSSLEMAKRGPLTFNKEARAYHRKAELAFYETEDLDCMDPAMAVYPPGRHAGSNSEIYMSKARAYLDENKDREIEDASRGTQGIRRPVFEGLVDFNYLRAVVEPGEAVGVIAAQSIGEPSTQMTLNTFHLAGHAAKNVTLGIPRLREILMTASANMKTPTMTLPLIPELSKEEGEMFAAGISRRSLAEIIEHTQVKERLAKGMFEEGRSYEVYLQFYPTKEYCDAYSITIADVAKALEYKFIPALCRSFDAELEKRAKEMSLKVASSDSRPDIGQSAGRVEEARAQPNEQNEGGDSDDDEGGDDDATNAKRRLNANEGQTYEEEDEEDQEIARDAQRHASPEPEEDDDEGYGGSPSDSDAMDADSDADDAQRMKVALKQVAVNRENRIKETFAHVRSFQFDERDGSSCKVVLEYSADAPKLLLLPMVKQAAKRALIQEIAGISSATVTTVELKDKSTEQHVLTSGANLVEMREYQDIIIPHRIRTNDVWAMRCYYGVEAARNTIIAELQEVFGAHSIDVNMRHLTLVADYMTRSGSYVPFSRRGMSAKSSPLAKMSFETTMAFLKDAVCEGEKDDLASPSSRITMGSLGRMGTGGFDVVLPVA